MNALAGNVIVLVLLGYSYAIRRYWGSRRKPLSAHLAGLALPRGRRGGIRSYHHRGAPYLAGLVRSQGKRRWLEPGHLAPCLVIQPVVGNAGFRGIIQNSSRMPLRNVELRS